MMPAAPREKVVRMYAARTTIYPRDIAGRYASLRWLCTQDCGSVLNLAMQFLLQK